MAFSPAVFGYRHLLKGEGEGRKREEICGLSVMGRLGREGVDRGF